MAGLRRRIFDDFQKYRLTLKIGPLRICTQVDTRRPIEHGAFMLKGLPLGTLNGAAQDNVELAIARGILEMEKGLSQSIDIPQFIEGENKRHGLVPDRQLAEFAANIKSAHSYVAAQKPVDISRAGYYSYQASGLEKSIGEVKDMIGNALDRLTPKTT